MAITIDVNCIPTLSQSSISATKVTRTELAKSFSPTVDNPYLLGPSLMMSGKYLAVPCILPIIDKHSHCTRMSYPALSAKTADSNGEMLLLCSTFRNAEIDDKLRYYKEFAFKCEAAQPTWSVTHIFP